MRSIIVLAGASGAGKTSVAMELLSKSDEYRLIRSATTRAPRGDGHDGEYLYYTEEEFKALVSRDKLLEVDKNLWKNEVEDLREFYKQFGDRLPAEISEQLNNLENRLNK